ncbi:MAG TPA: diguanylate cyclase [Thermomicrobiales bacterium]|nr:diguanylate cyclase [Thermomicrobiales bacterium]
MDAPLDVAALLAAAGAAFLCWRASRHAERTRSTWQLLTVGSLIWLIGAAIDAGRTPPSSRDLGAFLFAIAGTAGLALLVRRHRPYDREETVAGLLAGVATMAVGFEFLVRPLLHEAVTAIDRDARRVDLGLQIGAVGLIFPIALALGIGVTAIRHRVLVLLLASCLAPAVASALTGGRADATARGLSELPALPALGWLIGFVLLGAAAWLAQREPARPVGREPFLLGAYLRRVGVVTCVCALAVTVAAVDARHRPGTEWVVVAAAAACGILIAARLVTVGVIAERLVERTRERDHLVTVLDLSTAIAGTLEVDRLLPALAAAAAQAVDRTRVELTLFAPDGQIERRACHGLTAEDESALAEESAGHAMSPPSWPVGTTVRSGDEPVFSPVIRKAYRAAGKRQVLIAPLRAEGRVIGTVEIWSPHDERPFSPAEIAAATAIGREGGLAIQNARLLAETRTRAEERAMLLRVAQAATSSLELRTALTEIAQASLGVAGAECCSIVLWHPETDEFELGAEQTIPEWPGVEEPGRRFPRDCFGSDSLVMVSRMATRFDCESLELPELERAHMQAMGTESVLVVPLINGDLVLGTFNLLSRQRGAFDAGAARLGTEIAAQTALAIHNARLLEAARRHGEEQTALLRVSRAVSSSLMLGDVLGEVARASLGVAGAEGCEIELWHPERDETELVAHDFVTGWVVNTSDVGTLLRLADWPATRRMLTSRETLCFDRDDPTLTEPERQVLFRDDTRSGLAIPIVLDDRCLGMLSLYSRQPDAFSARAVALGQDLAAQAALAIERAQLHAALEARARTDGLTGLLNRGATEETLDAELTRARRTGLPLAILLIDLDGFKHVNDRRGHLVGDRVLQEVAGILRTSVRDGDSVGRYGGDEFLVLLPDADEFGARVVADRILAATKAARVPADTPESWVSIHLSIGRAVYPHAGSTHEELIATADEAMYATKLGATLRR